MNAPVAPAERVGLSIEPDAQNMASAPELDGTEVWAVCCSGGGIRSASYCLGALQSLEQAGFLDKARLILGVSGGSYISASRALVAHGLEVSPASADSARLPRAGRLPRTASDGLARVVMRGEGVS